MGSGVALVSLGPVAPVSLLCPRVIKCFLKEFERCAKIFVAIRDAIIVRLRRWREPLAIHDVSHIGGIVFFEVLLPIEVREPFIDIQPFLAIAGNHPEADRDLVSLGRDDVRYPPEDETPIREHGEADWFRIRAAVPHLRLAHVAAKGEVDGLICVFLIHGNSPFPDFLLCCRRELCGPDLQEGGGFFRDIAEEGVRALLKVADPELTKAFRVQGLAVFWLIIDGSQFGDRVSDRTIVRPIDDPAPAAPLHRAARRFDLLADRRESFRLATRAVACIAASAARDRGLSEADQKTDPMRDFVIIGRALVLTEFQGPLAQIGLQIDLVVAILSVSTATNVILAGSLGSKLRLDRFAPARGVSATARSHESVDEILKFSIAGNDLFDLFLIHAIPSEMDMETAATVNPDGRYRIDRIQDLAKISKPRLAAQNRGDDFASRLIAQRSVSNYFPEGLGRMIISLSLARDASLSDSAGDGRSVRADIFDFDAESEIFRKIGHWSSLRFVLGSCRPVDVYDYKQLGIGVNRKNHIFLFFFVETPFCGTFRQSTVLMEVVSGYGKRTR